MAKKPTKTAASSAGAWKKKKWHNILAPEAFKKVSLGDCPVVDPNVLMGRTVSVNLMNLTRNMKDQNTNITFEVTEVKGDTALTQIKALTMMPASVKRMVRRGRDRIDASFICETGDKKMIAVKPLFITTGTTKNSKLTAIRKLAIQNMTNWFSKMTYDAIINDIISKRMNRTLRQQLNSIYPLRSCEIREISLVHKKKMNNIIEADKDAAEMPEPEPPKRRSRPDSRDSRRPRPEARPAAKPEEVKAPAKEEAKPAAKPEEGKAEAKEEPKKEEAKEEKPAAKPEEVKEKPAPKKAKEE